LHAIHMARQNCNGFGTGAFQGVPRHGQGLS